MRNPQFHIPHPTTGNGNWRLVINNTLINWQLALALGFAFGPFGPPRSSQLARSSSQEQERPAGPTKDQGPTGLGPAATKNKTRAACTCASATATEETK
jgi:hypothetical protein